MLMSLHPLLAKDARSFGSAPRRVGRDPDVERLAAPYRRVERAHRLLERRRAPDGAYSRFISAIIGLAWIAVVSGLLYVRSPSTVSTHDRAAVPAP
jgi:hypothetical protein